MFSISNFSKFQYWNFLISRKALRFTTCQQLLRANFVRVPLSTACTFSMCFISTSPYFTRSPFRFSISLLAIRHPDTLHMLSYVNVFPWASECNRYKPLLWLDWTSLGDAYAAIKWQASRPKRIHSFYDNFVFSRENNLFINCHSLKTL